MASKKIKEYICPYCGYQLYNNKWTVDHIIPLNMGGPRKFKLISCKMCNTKIGREIEQLAMGSTQIIGPIGELTSKGFKIKYRRKKKILPMHRKVGLCMGKRVKLYRDMERNGQLCLGFLEPPEDELVNRNKGRAIFPLDNETDRVQIALSSLAVKIILGTCCWFWENKFTLNCVGNDLRERIWNRTMDDILDIGSESKHVTIEIENKDDLSVNEKNEIDAFDNSPHHTITIIKYDESIYGLINLFGGFESMMWLGNINTFKEFSKIEKGIVLIAKTTRNSLVSMSLDEYENYKKQKIET